MPQSDPQTSAITVADLRRILRVVLPHLSNDPTLPLLGDVEVTFAERTITPRCHRPVHLGCHPRRTGRVDPGYSPGLFGALVLPAVMACR